MITSPGLINLDFADVGRLLYGKQRGMPSWVLVLVAVKNALSKRLVKPFTLHFLKLQLMVAEDVIVNITGGLDMTLIEAEEASEIVNQAAGHGVNIWLGTSIDESLKDEIPRDGCYNWASVKTR